MLKCGSSTGSSEAEMAATLLKIRSSSLPSSTTEEQPTASTSQVSLQQPDALSLPPTASTAVVDSVSLVGEAAARIRPRLGPGTTPLTPNRAALQYYASRQGILTAQQNMLVQQALLASPGRRIALLNLLHQASGSNMQVPSRQPIPLIPPVENLSTSEQFRRDEVEKALRSKPQRGRKRSNLSEVERVELTRTRNREHAKSTRVRKKARHQELLDNEQKYLALVKEQKLERQRRQAVCEFVEARECTLQSLSQSSSCSAKKQRNDSEYRRIEELLADVATTTYDGTNDVPGSIVEDMKQFDESFLSTVSGKFQGRPELLLSHSIKGSVDDVGMTKSGVAFAEVKIQLSKPLQATLWSALLKIRFACNTTKITAIEVSVISDALANGDFDHLKKQSSYPSVVSLDHDRRDCGDVGMDI